MSAQNQAIGTLTTAIRTAIDGRLVDLHTALPGVVRAVYADDQEVDVEIAIQRIVRDTSDEERVESVPVLSRIPLAVLGVPGLSVTLPVASGDEVVVVFLERDASAWIEGGKILPPESRRKHSYSDGVAIPLKLIVQNRIGAYQTGAIEIRTDDRSGRITLKADGTVEIMTTSSVEIGDGKEDIVSLLSELCTTIQGLTVSHSGERPLSAASQALVAALKARVDTLKV